MLWNGLMYACMVWCLYQCEHIHFLKHLWFLYGESSWSPQLWKGGYTCHPRSLSVPQHPMTAGPCMSLHPAWQAPSTWFSTSQAWHLHTSGWVLFYINLLLNLKLLSGWQDEFLIFRIQLNGATSQNFSSFWPTCRFSSLPRMTHAPRLPCLCRAACLMASKETRAHLTASELQNHKHEWQEPHRHGDTKGNT